MERTTADLDTTRLRALFENSPDAIVVADESGRIVRANRRVESLFGYEPADLEGEPVETLVPEADRPDHPARREAYVADPTTRPMGAGLDLRARRADGSTVPVDISLSPIETEEGLEVMAAIRDTTERETLRNKYQTVMEAAPDAMFVADAETGELREANHRAAELLDTSVDALVGRSQTDLHPPEDAARYRALFRRHAEDEAGTISEFPDGDPLLVETAGGERVPVEISAQATELAGRRSVIGMFRDVTDRREYEQELERQIERLETLAEVLSHDLRNPLTVAAANLDLARERGRVGDVEAAAERLDRVETAHDRMSALVDDALALIREGYGVDAVEPHDLASTVRDCWAHVRTGDATLEVMTEGVVYADSRRVGNLFENLFHNAIEHGGEGVTVRVGLTGDGFFVADDGPGIPEPDRDAVLEPGWSSDEDGTGLGLNIVAEVAAAHDWDVAVGESDDGGARFDFTGVRTASPDDAAGDGGADRGT